MANPTRECEKDNDKFKISKMQLQNDPVASKSFFSHVLVNFMAITLDEFACRYILLSLKILCTSTSVSNKITT